LTVEDWAADQVAIWPAGLTYSVHLRAGLRFSDGTPISASDYAFSLSRALDACVQSVWAPDLAAIQGADAYSEARSCVHSQDVAPPLLGQSIFTDNGARLLTIRMTHPMAAFLAALTVPAADAVERGVIAGADLGKDDAWTAALLKGPTGQGAVACIISTRTTRPARMASWC
jgi:hypothetical protein